jgi:hypothetical protein
MINTVYYKMTEGLDEEGIAKLQVSLDNAALIRDPLLHQPRRARRLVSVPGSPETVPVTPAKRWTAPQGWTPPNWDERRSYQAAQAFMGFRKEVK